MHWSLACGTVGSTRKGVPPTLKENVDQNDSLFRKAKMTESYMTAFQWKDKRDVFALSTIHGNAVGNNLHHKPMLISGYNKYMGVVDHNDQLLVWNVVHTFVSIHAFKSGTPFKAKIDLLSCCFC